MFPYVTYFAKFIDKEWERPQRTFSVPKRVVVPYPFEESLLKKWASPPVFDPLVSRLNKITTILIVGTPAFKDPANRRSKAVFPGPCLPCWGQLCDLYWPRPCCHRLLQDGQNCCTVSWRSNRLLRSVWNWPTSWCMALSMFAMQLPCFAGPQYLL